MKTTPSIQLIFFLLFFVSTPLLGQTKHNYDYSNKNAIEVLNALEQQKGFRFMFIESWIKDKTLSFKLDQADSDLLLRTLSKALKLDYLYYESTKMVVFILPTTTFTIESDSITKVLADENNEIRQVIIGSEESTQRDVKLFGRVTDPIDNTPLDNVSILIQGLNIGTTTNNNGYYNITIPQGEYLFIYSRVDKASQPVRVFIYEDGNFNVELYEKIRSLDDVVVTSERDNSNVSESQTGIEKLEMAELKKEPSALGEVDIVRNVVKLAGVTSVSEVSGGFNVRGGGAYENLVLLDKAIIFNPSHSFGFFSAFNQDMVESATLYKSYIPSSYGGRASSVLQINSKTLNDDYILQGGVGIISSRISWMPQYKNENVKSVTSARLGYGDWLFRTFYTDLNNKDITSKFYEAYHKTELSSKKNSKVSLSIYSTGDTYEIQRDTANDFTNLAATINWDKLISDNTFINAYLSGSRFRANVTANQGQLDAFTFGNGNTVGTVGASISTSGELFQDLQAGIESNFSEIKRGHFSPDSLKILSPIEIKNDRYIENAAFVSGTIPISKLELNAGLRYSHYTLLAPAIEYLYTEGQPLKEGNIIDSIQYDNGAVKSYSGFEPRVSLGYMVSSDLSLKAAFVINRQYLHRISANTSVTPIDTWKASDRYIKPIVSKQYSIGIFKNFDQNHFETSLEAYYKISDNLLEYNGIEELNLNKRLETSTVNADGTAYGIEAVIKKTRGDIKGTISYTYSRAFRETNSAFKEENINNGNRYPADFDQPHSLFLETSYKLNRRLTLFANYTFNSGRAFTRPSHFFPVQEVTIPFFEERNNSRLPNFSRLDLALNISENLRIDDNWKTDVTISIYNVTGRDNIFSFYYKKDNMGSRLDPHQFSLLPSPMLSVTWNFRYFNNDKTR